jgi:hypothetical protein
MNERLRILILAANPANMSRLHLEAEHRLLRNMMRDNAEAGNCELLVEWAARATELQTALTEFKPHIVHFAGHGDKDGICLENDEGMGQSVSKEELGLLFNLSLKQLRLVVLNACYSAPQIERLGQSVDYIVGTNVPIADETAVRFTANFYQALAVGSTVREAFHKAQGQLAESGENAEARQYELRIRSGVNENEPLLPPSQDNIVDIAFDNLNAEKAVVANRFRKGPGASSSSHERQTNEKNTMRIKGKSINAGEFYLVNDMTEND